MTQFGKLLTRLRPERLGLDQIRAQETARHIDATGLTADIRKRLFR
jgi:hypothetical protein